MRTMRLLAVATIALMLGGCGGCGLLGLDTPGEAAFWAQQKQDEISETAAHNAREKAEQQKAEAAARASDLAAQILAKAQSGQDPGHDPVDLRMAARQLGFNKETRREYVNGVLTKERTVVVGHWTVPKGAKFTFEQNSDGYWLAVWMPDGTFASLDFKSEANFAAFVRSCQAVDQAWKSLK